jgi:two-component system phosphate regulon sensor histidine kinase PhoR
LKKEAVGKPTPEILPDPIKRLINQSLTNKTVCCDEVKIQHREKGLLHLNLVASPRTIKEKSAAAISEPLEEISGVILVLQDRTVHYRLLQMRKDFIANASHELKTPITVIRGFAETLHDHTSLPAETVAGITSKIVRNCNRMATTVHNLLALADIEKLPAARLMHISLLSIIDRAVTNLLSIYPDVMCHIRRQDSADLYELTCDADLIETAINNLLDNAVKYSKAAAEITISLSYEGESIRLDISDKGIGIPENELEQIFQRFYRVNKTQSNRVSGSGLGLSIVETIVQKHGGTIHVSSELGKGSTFTLRLPIQNKK